MFFWARHKLAQIVARLLQRLLPGRQRSFVNAIFHFDADGSLVAGISQYREKPAPMDVSQTWQFGYMVFQRGSEDSYLVSSADIDAHILGVDMEDPIGEVFEWLQIVHLLPYFFWASFSIASSSGVQVPFTSSYSDMWKYVHVIW